MTAPQPASSRGGSNATRDLVNRARMKKAPQISAVQEMAAVDSAPEGDTTPAAPATVLPAVAAPEPAPAPEPASAAPAVAAVPETTPRVQQKAAPAPAAPQSAAPAARQPGVKKSEKEGYKKTGNGWQTLEQWNRTRSTYGATRHLTGHLSLADYIVAALEFYDQHIEEKFNNGEPFDFNPMNIPQGRPVGSTNQPKG